MAHIQHRISSWMVFVHKHQNHNHTQMNLSEQASLTEVLLTGS